MKNLVLLFVLFGIASPSYAERLAIFRGDDGKMTSQQDVRKMIRRAEKNGTIEVWLTFDVAVELRPSQQTPAKLARQRRETRAAVRTVIDPLLDSGLIRSSKRGKHDAPGCFVAITPEGIRSLVRNRKVVQITN